MTWLGGPAVILWLCAWAPGLARGASCGGSTCHVDDGGSLLQAAADLGSTALEARELAGASEAAPAPAAGRGGTLCSLAPKGELAPEVAAFLRVTANSTQLERLLSQEWVQACASGATDAGLVSQLREVVHAFAVAPSAAPMKTQSDKAVQNLSREDPEADCSVLRSQLRDWGVSFPERVLDYGCGFGDSLAAYGKCGVGRNNVGIDVQDVRADKNKEFFQFVQLDKPYPRSLKSKISTGRLTSAFDFAFSEEVFHHIGSERDIIATSRQLGRTLAPCGAFVLQDWDNPGTPDMTPLYDLTHTFWSVLCLPYTKEKGEKCVGDISDKQLHEMWEGESTIYLSVETYAKIVEKEAGVELIQKRRITGAGWNEILHPFQLVFQKPC